MMSQTPGSGRAELAMFPDGMPLSADLPRGEFCATRFADGSFRIDRADPRILLSGELLDQFSADPPPPGVSFDPGPNCCPSLVGAVVKLSAVNRTVIYRITDFVPRIYAYIAEWPD